MPMGDICSAAGVVSILILPVPQTAIVGIYGQRSLRFWWVSCCCCSSCLFLARFFGTSFPIWQDGIDLGELQSPPFVSIGLLDLFLEFLSCCHVVAVAFLPHEFLRLPKCWT
jgi:hypothetical protein